MPCAPKKFLLLSNAHYFFGIILALAGSAFFGFIPLFAIPLIETGYTVETVALYRFGAAALMLAPCLVIHKSCLKIPVICKIMLIASFYFLDVLLFFHALKYLPGGITATLEFLCPVITLIIMILFFNEKFHWQSGVAITFALVGVWLLSNAPDSGANSKLAYLGVILALLAALFNSLYFIGFKWIDKENPDPAQATFYVMLSCALLGFFNGVAQGKLQWIEPGWPLIYALLLALLTAVLSNLCLIAAIKRIGPWLTSILGVMEPVTAVLGGIIFLGEEMTPAILAGLPCSVLAVLLAIRSGNNQAG